MTRRRPQPEHVEGLLVRHVETSQVPEGIVVPVMSRDPEEIAWLAPRVADQVYPEIANTGEVLWHQPIDPLDADHEWSEAAVRVGARPPR